jgi:hypothetical protein
MYYVIESGNIERIIDQFDSKEDAVTLSNKINLWLEYYPQKPKVEFHFHESDFMVDFNSSYNSGVYDNSKAELAIDEYRTNVECHLSRSPVFPVVENRCYVVFGSEYIYECDGKLKTNPEACKSMKLRFLDDHHYL